MTCGVIATPSGAGGAFLTRVGTVAWRHPDGGATIAIATTSFLRLRWPAASPKCD